MQAALINDENFKIVHSGRKKFKTPFARMMSLVIRGLKYKMTDQEIVDTLELSTAPKGEKKIGYNGRPLWAQVATAIEKSGGMKAGTIQFSAKGTGFG